MDGVFISYRRDDEAAYAGWLCEFIGRQFPNNDVFMDINAIAPGQDFLNQINSALAASKVLIAVIGRNWEGITGDMGTRRLDNPDDYVVHEVRSALSRGMHIIPVLVGGAVMPNVDTLPEALKRLARFNALEVSHKQFGIDAQRLCEAIVQMVNTAKAESGLRDGQSALKFTELKEEVHRFSLPNGINVKGSVFSVNLFNQGMVEISNISIVSMIYYKGSDTPIMFPILIPRNAPAKPIPELPRFSLRPGEPKKILLAGYAETPLDHKMMYYPFNEDKRYGLDEDREYEIAVNVYGVSFPLKSRYAVRLSEGGVLLVTPIEQTQIHDPLASG